MAVTRDTSADDAAELHEPAPAPGSSDPPVTLTGAQAHRVRAALRSSYERLHRIEGHTKIYREREVLRGLRHDINIALAYLPEPKRGAP